jgi:hypothetical protein
VASESFNRLNPGLQIMGKRIRSAQPKCHPVVPLDGAGQGKGKGGGIPAPGPVRMFEITFTIFSVRPNDWDNIHVKCLQDMLIKPGCVTGLPDDCWHQLQGRIISKKAHSPEEEGTQIEIKEIC